MDVFYFQGALRDNVDYSDSYVIISQLYSWDKTISTCCSWCSTYYPQVVYEFQNGLFCNEFYLK